MFWTQGVRWTRGVRRGIMGPMQQPQLTVHGFETSNNMKVRIALGFKGIPYEFRTIDPAEREAIVRLSGQYLTPVIEHEGVVLFDSAAILRYLDANFPGTPKLYGDSRDEQWAIEDQESFARTRLAGPMMEIIHRRVAGTGVDEALGARCAAAFDRATVKLAERLDSQPWLAVDRMSAADITAAAVLFRVRQAELFPWPAAGDRILAWLDAVMAFDGRARVS